MAEETLFKELYAHDMTNGFTYIGKPADSLGKELRECVTIPTENLTYDNTDKEICSDYESMAKRAYKSSEKSQNNVPISLDKIVATHRIKYSESE